jgi:copper homeostasis protein
MKVEICASSLLSVKNAISAGADRVELCSAFQLGGITSSPGLIKESVKLDKIPIHCLIRPREGDFFYDSNEIKIINNDILMAKELGCKGVVVGCLNYDYSLDLKILQKFIDLAYPMEITFHRAFDLVKEPFKAMYKLIDLGFNRILSSGQKKTAELGMELLKELKNKSIGQITIMPGAGINIKNCLKFKKEIFEAIHLSAWQPFRKENLSDKSNNIKTFDYVIGHSDKNIIKDIILKINK